MSFLVSYLDKKNMNSHLPLLLIPPFLGNYVLGLPHTNHPPPDFSGLGRRTEDLREQVVKNLFYTRLQNKSKYTFPVFPLYVFFRFT